MTTAPRTITRQDRRNARWYLTGLGLSLIGDSALSLVAGIWAKQLTGSSATAGLVMTCIYLPSLFGPVAGLVVDRVQRKRFIIAVNLVTAVAVGSLVLLQHRSQVWLLFVVMTCYGTSLVLVAPAETALFSHAFPDALRQRINGWRLGMQEIGRLVAPLVGAGLFTVLGGSAVASLDAFTFVVAAFATTRLRIPTEPPPPARRAWHTELNAGFRHIRDTPRLARIVLVAAVVLAVSGVGVAAQFSMVSALHRHPAYLGVFSALLGAGSIIASLTSAKVIARIGLEHLVALGLLAFAVGTLLRTTGQLAFAWAGSFVLGFALPWVFLACLNAAQELTPSNLQGRVAAAVTFLLFGPQAPTQALGSILIAHLDYQEIYIASAVIAAVLIPISMHCSPVDPPTAA
ncbi:MFS transporter [Rudaeicoccus suwonensis]|uniref:MFS transporter n=1 Tax=Rudaeicoccus suwonensis TaxID=657409 RepID=A0A561E0W9_9MICO|nr:MFS transporter [Rudaeicoccus suwonensis]TWE09288.1 MFS transporter [Rudaeicoccus suwonensis]